MGRKRGSYRTVRRFFESDLPWPTLLWEFFRVHCLDPTHVYLLAGDETVTSKAGKQTHGVGRYFSSLYDQPIRGLSFFCLSLVSVERASAWPLRVSQMLPIHKKKQSSTPPAASKNRPSQSSSSSVAKAKPKRSPGRPKGSQNKDKSQVSLNAELRLIQSEIQALLLIGVWTNAIDAPPVCACSNRVLRVKSANLRSLFGISGARVAFFDHREAEASGLNLS